MKDVAALAGVSLGTVSNVLNQPHLVAPATQARVHAAIAKLGWVRNDSARQLRAGRSLVIGMVVMDVSNPFFTDIVRGAETHLAERGFSLYIGNSDQLLDREATLLRHFEEQRVDGIILAPIVHGGEQAALITQRGIPLVLVDRATNSGFCGVGTDDIQGGLLAGQHLVAQGHTRLAFVGGPADLAQVSDRRRGLELAIAGRPVTLEAVDTAATDVAAGRAAADQLAARPPGERPTAVAAANDLVAIGLLQGFVEAGLRVPEDIAIVGYDDILFAAAAAVPLSSIRQPRHDLGVQSAALLLDEIEASANGRSHSHRTIKMAPELVVRRSSERL
jgi:LacI family transcriptional regulator